MFAHGQLDVEIADRARLSLRPFVATGHQPLLKISCGGRVVGRLDRNGQVGSRIGHDLSLPRRCLLYSSEVELELWTYCITVDS